MISAKTEGGDEAAGFLHELAQRPGVVDQHVAAAGFVRPGAAALCNASACDTPGDGTPEIVAEFSCWKWVIVSGTVSCRTRAIAETGIGAPLTVAI